MAAYNEESVQWLYDKLQDSYDTGSIDEFKEDLKDDETRKWYHNEATKMGLNVGDEDTFRSLVVPEEVEAPQRTGTVVDQTLEDINRATGHMPQDVQDMAFSAQPQTNEKSSAEEANTQMFQKPAVDPEPWKAEGLTKEQYEDIAWMRGVNRSTPLAVDEEGQVWSNAEVATGQREQKTERTYQTKESWDDTYSRKANRYGQLRYGWRRGQRFRQLDTDGEHLAGYVAQTDPDTAAAAEQMSDQQLIEAYNKLSKQINRGYTGGIWGFSKTPEGQVLGAQLSAIGKELHFRDLGYEHTSSVPGRGDVDYRSIMTEPDVAEEAKRLSSTGDRDAEVARLYQEGMTSGNMEAAERALLASAALYCKERNIDIDTAYAMVEADAFNTAMRAPLQADVDKIYQEEKDVQSQKKTEAISGMRHPQSAGGAMHQELAMRRAAPTGKMLNTMARRAINESAASRAYYNMRLREYMRGGSMDIMHARAAAMNDVRNLFRDIEVAKATPDSSWGIVANAFVMENMPVQAIRGLANLATGDYESDMIIDEGMARAKANASVATNILAGVAPFVADSALGSFKIPGLVGKGVSTGLTKLTTWSLNRTLGLGEEVVMRRLGGSWVYRTVTGALSGSANFGTYMGMSAAVQGFRQGNASWEGTWEGAKHGLWDGLIFGGVNGSMSKIVESAKGGWAIAAEAGALTTEAGVFTALDYMRTGEITAESVGQSLGMVLASRAMNFKGWASDVAARVNGTKWQHQVKGQVKWSKETRDELQEKYPTLCRLMGGDNLALDLVKGLRTNEYKYNEKGEVDSVATANAIEREWAAMVEDPTVDFAAKRMANYVLNGQIVPTPAVCNWRITEPGEDGISYGETIDINGQVIERFKLKNDDERRRFEQGVALDAERNRIGLEQAAWGSRELEPVIVDAIDAVASEHGLDRDELAKAYFTEDKKIRGTVMKAAVKEAEALVIAEMRTKTNPQEAVEKKYGVDLEEVRKTPIKDRTEAEQQALDEYELRLTDRYDEAQDKSTAELVADDMEQSRNDGFEAQGDERADIKERLEDAANALTEMRIDPRQFDSMDENAISDWLESRGNNADEVDAVMEYLDARSAFEGIRDRVQDEASKRIEEATKETDDRTNNDTGMIHPVVMGDDREAFVVSGRVVVNADGTIDLEKSDRDIVVRYPDEEQPVMTTADKIKSGEATIDPEAAKQETADGIMQEVAGEAVSQMNRDLAFNEGDTFTVLVDGKPVELTVVGTDHNTGNPILQDSAGRRAPAYPDIVQQMHDEWREWVKNGRPQEEQPVAPTERTETPVEGQQPLDRLERAREALADKGFDVVIYDEAPVEYLEQKILPSDVVSEELKDVVREYIDARKEAERDEAPAIEDGSVAMPTPGEGDPQEMLDYFRDAGWSDTVADKTITNSIIQAAERLEKAQRELEESKETDPQKLAELEAMVNAEQRELDYWNEVGRRKWGNAEQPAAPVAENEMQPVEEPTAEIGGTAEEYQGDGMSDEMRERMDDGTGIVGIVDNIARQLGLKVRDWDGPKNIPGYIDPDNGVIYINRNRVEGTRDTYRFTLGHELTHGLKKLAEDLGRPELYEALHSAALSAVRVREGSGYDKFVSDLMNRYRSAHYMDAYDKAIAAGMSKAEAVEAGRAEADRVTQDFIEEEIVCDTVGELLSGDESRARELLEQVEDKSVMQRIKDYFTELLTKVRDAFGAGSKEYDDLDNVINRFNEMYNEVLKQREEMGTSFGYTESGVDGETSRTSDRLSVSANFEGMGFQFWDDHLDADGKKQAMEDKDGNFYVMLGDRRFDYKNHITAEDLADTDSALNFMLGNAVKTADNPDGRISPITAYRIRSNYAKLLNLFLDLGAAEKGGVPNLERNYQMVAETAFRCVSTNGDKQYGVSLDITRVCKKNEAVINTISRLQLEQGYGATPAQILDIYLSTHEEGYQVPCPVCYVFSRYIRNGKFASAAINGMEMYGQHLPGGSDPWSVERWVEELGKLGGLEDVDPDQGVKDFEDLSTVANDAINRNLTLIDDLGARLATELNKEKPNKRYIRQLEKDIKKLADEYKAACDYFGQMSQTNWIKNFAIRKVNGSWKMWEDARLPEDMEDFKAHALDLRRTAETIENYPAIQRLRKSGGSASGKEIHQASNNEMGEAIMGIGQKGAPKYRNYYKEAMETSDPVEREKLLKTAREKFDNAVDFARKQNLRGGQRMWSWSDNIERLSPDVISNLMQLEMLGAGLQSYSKQLEGVEMVARMNGYVNGSLMAKDNGYQEVSLDQCERDANGVLRLKEDITDTVYDTWHKTDRTRITAGNGAMVHEVDGKNYVLIYDDVIGIDAHGTIPEEDGSRKLGLFDLNNQYDRAGNILVTMNDMHSKLALADDRVHFIIPWHSSGANQHILAQMFNMLGQDISVRSTDYTPMQEEKDYGAKKDGKMSVIPQHLREVWDAAKAHAEERGWSCGVGDITTTGKRVENNKAQMEYRRLRDAIMDGTVKADPKNKDYQAIMADEFLKQVYDAVQDAGGKMTADDKKYIYPYEYWDKSSTLGTADENGWRYMEYCRRLGRRPKFSGKYGKGDNWSDEGDFTGSKGYWKTLIDRRMYDREGNFQDMTPIDSSDFDTDLVNISKMREKYTETRVADDEGEARIVQNVQQKEMDRTGSYEYPYGIGQGRAAKALSKVKLTGAEKKEMIERTAPNADGSNVKFSIREEEPPKKTKKVYKLFNVFPKGHPHAGEPMTLFIDTNQPLPRDTWLNADAPDISILETLDTDKVYLIGADNNVTTSRPVMRVKNRIMGLPRKSEVEQATKDGSRWVTVTTDSDGARAYHNVGINGADGVTTYAMRPGWHATDAPSARHIGAGRNGGNAVYRKPNQRWFEVEIAADYDYNEEARSRYAEKHPNMSREDIDAGMKGDIPERIPKDGYYNFKTNSNANPNQSWYISGAIKIGRPLSEAEARRISREMGVEEDLPYKDGVKDFDEDDFNPDGPGGGKSIDSVVAEAEQMTETNPTDGQKESGNYKKGHVKVDGFDISIEQPKGSVRSGVDADGKEWSQEMHNTYGYIRGTEGVDGDHIDAFLSDHLDGWNGNVYVVDQVNKDRSFDEHKVMYGFNSEQEAREAYLSNYEEGWTGLGNITGVSREEFKKWVDSSHRKNKPFAEYKNVKPLQGTGTEDRARFSISEEEREEQTHSDNFKRWFGDWENDPEDASKVVDENGEPKVVLHGTPNGDFYVFDPEKAGSNTDQGWLGTGFYFYGNAPEYASQYAGKNGRVLQVYLDIKNPYIASVEEFNRLAEANDPEMSRRFREQLEDEGYDGVYYNGDLNEEWVAFRPEQIKSATENNGEFDPENPDIRFSVSEESQKIFDTAKRKFGETKDIREAGYVLPDGVMLDFSGRHELDPGSDSSFLAGGRTTDHRAVNQISFVYDENGDEVDTGVSSDMPDFIRRGAIRIDNNAGLINLSTKPTAGQRNVLRQLVAENGGTVDVDFGDGWDTDHHVEYNDAKATRVLGDIDRYFDEGIKPESNARFSLGEEIENYQPRDVSWERAMLDHLLQNAARNEENKGIRSQAVKEVNRKLNDLFGRMAGDYDFDPSLDISRGTRAATTAQRKYDRWTVDELVSMAKSMLKSGMYDGLTPHQVNRLIGKINQGAGRTEIQEQMNTVFDVLMNANLNGWKEQLNKLMRIKPIRINDQGVRVMGQVDRNYATTLKTLKDALELTQEELSDKIAEASDRLASDNSNEAHNAANEMEGLILAQQYNDLIGKYDADNKGIKAEIRKQLEKVYDFYQVPVLDEDGNPKYHQRTGEQLFETRKRLKPEYGGLDEDGNRVTPTEEAKAERKRIEGIVASLESKRRENQVQMSEGYAQLTDALGGGVAAAVTRAKEFRENEKLRKQQIYHAANSDLLDVDSNTETIDPSQQASPNNWSLVRGLLGPLATFDKMLRFFGRRNANGEGRLFNMFMRRQIDCGHNEWRSKKAGMDEMDAKAKELFGKKWMTMGNEMRDGKKFPFITLSYFDKVGKPRTIELRQDEAVYIYCVNKMRDGQMKLQAMGIDDAKVEQIKQRLDPHLVKLADWYQHEFLPKHRSRYNEVYERMFGTPMAHIDNYIHLNINKRETASNQELGERVGDQRGPTYVTGSIKERKTNVTPIELRTSIFDLAWSEHDKMEHWAAWGEFSRDLKDLTNYRNFRAKLFNMKSTEFGNGKELLDNFKRCAAIVTGDYDNPGRHAKVDRAATNLAKGVTSAKIGFRVFTALKQTLSFPAFFSDARPGDLIFAMSNAEGSVQWAMENLPGFSKRWQSRQAGDTRLMETDSDWKVWRNSAVKSIGRVSMLPNAAVDCLTVAIGARGVYLTAKRRYLSYGYTEAQAEKKALQDAAISYNASQQSSEGAFTSAQQVDRTLAGVATTVFRNASMGYERRFTQGIRNLKNMSKSGYREDVIENTKKQMMEEGLSEEQAQRAAERVYNRMKWHSMLDVVNFGFVLPFFWNLGPAMVYILTGNDDEEKKTLIRDSALHALYGPIEGLSMGGTMSELANIFTGSMLMDKKTFQETMRGLKYRNFNPLPIFSDMQSLFNSFSTDAWSGMNDLFNLAVQMGVGVNPETFTDMAMAFIDASNGDFGIAKESAMGFLRLINAPKSQVDKLYMDELGLTQEEAAKMSWEDLARRYAKFNAAKDAPLAAAFLPDEVEEAREERYIKKFYERIKEKLEKSSDEDLQHIYDQGDEQKKMVGKEMAKRAGLEDGERFSKKTTSKVESTIKGHEAYQSKRSYADMAEDVLLQKAKADAANAGDDDRADAIEKVLKSITKLRNGDPKKGVKGMGVDRETDDRILEKIRETRSKALKELGITR